MISMREIVNNRSGSEARLVWLVGSTRTLTLADQGWRCGLTPFTSISPSRPINIKRGSVQIAREKYQTNPIQQFSGAELLPGVGDNLLKCNDSIALNLMTVQPEADQPKAETGADLVLHRTIENRGA